VSGENIEFVFKIKRGWGGVQAYQHSIILVY